MDKKDLIDRSLELKKHVAVIHSNSKISLLQRKISNALLFHAYDTLLTQDEHTIHISTLTKLIGYDSHDHKKIKQALMDLLSTVIEWNIIDGDKLDKENVWNASSVIADASIKGSLCTYSYSGKMRQLLYHPSVYGRLNMQVQAKFQSNYGLALYENCNRYQDIGQTPWFEYHKFRKLMGVEDNKYKIFRDFKTRVLDKSIEEVNKYSQILVDPIFKRLNRQIIAIQFQIKKRHGGKEEISPSIKEAPFKQVLATKFGLSKKQITELTTLYEESYIAEKIQIIESSASYCSGKIKNLGKYLLCALSDDYQANKTVSLTPIRSTERESNKEEVNFQNYLKEKVFKVFALLERDQKEKIIEEFKKRIARTVYLKVYEESGLENLLLQDQFLKFVLTTKNEITKEIETFEAWKKDHVLPLPTSTLAGEQRTIDLSTSPIFVSNM